MAKKVIDVSEHQGKIDWEKVKGQIDGAILRCGYGMDQTNQDDDYWSRNLSECERLGIPIGVYLYSYADTEAKAKSELAHILRLIKGHKFQLPIFIDLEQSGTEKMAKKTAQIVCDGLKDAGYTPGIYANLNWWTNYLKGVNGYRKWIAHYTSGSVDKYKNGYDGWQYSSKGKVSGISGNCDMNYWYADFGESSGTSTPKPSTSKPASNKNTIKVDGWWGKDTTTRLQQIFGTTVDGVVSNQFSCYKAQNPGLDSGWEWQSNPSGYSPLIKAIQKKVGAAQDGHIGPKTIKAIQKWMGTTQDGCFSGPSPCIKKLQQWINKQK